jgi:hypothetical protein
MDQKDENEPLGFSLPYPTSRDITSIRNFSGKSLGTFSTFEIVTTALLMDREKALIHPKLAFRRALEYLSNAGPMVKALFVETGGSEWVSQLDAKLAGDEADREKIQRGELEDFVELAEPVEKSAFFDFLKRCNPPNKMLNPKTTRGYVNALNRHLIFSCKFGKSYYIRKDSVRPFVELERARINEANSRDQRRSRGQEKNGQCKKRS